MRRRNKWLIGVLALPTSMVYANPCYVSPDGGHRYPFATWADAATHIQAAITAAEGVKGATILVRKGVYTGAGNAPVVTITRSVTLRSETGDPADVVIDGEGKRRGILARLTTTDSKVVIEGVTITNGYTAAAHGHGAGVYLDHTEIASGAAEIRHCVITGNFNGSPNGHNHGGGLASRGKAGSAFQTIVTDCRFSGNTTTHANSSGGGAAFQNTRLTMEDCRIIGNRADGDLADNQSSHGGGVYVANVPTGSVIRRTDFRGNVSGGGGGGTTGGGLAVYGADTDVLVEGCVFEHNSAPYGSGLMQQAGMLTLRNSRITQNPGGQAFYQGWGSSWPTSLVINCTIIGGIVTGRTGEMKVIDAMRDPAVCMDDHGAVQPVRTVDDWNRRRAATLRRIEQLTGPLPDRSRFPAPDLKVLQDDVVASGLRRQMIEYVTDSRDAPRVRAWLFSPTTHSCLEAGPAEERPRAAILCLHQTNRNIGKNEPAGLGGDTNMFYALELARRGFITLAPDFPGSGEYPGMGTFKHDYVSATMKGVVDNLRAVDILSGLRGVDPQRIGCIGHSLGGFNTLFTAVFDTRIKAMVSSCGYTSWRAYASRAGSIYNFAGGNYMPLISRDCESSPDLVPFDFHEVVAALAPRPFFINAPLRDDPFLVEGVRETIAAAKPIYELLGAADGLQSEHPDGGHSFPPEVRENAYRFLEQHLAGARPRGRVGPKTGGSGER